MDSRWLARVVAIAAALTLALGFAACGGSDDADGGGTPSAQQEGSDGGGGDGAAGNDGQQRKGGKGNGGGGSDGGGANANDGSGEGSAGSSGGSTGGDDIALAGNKKEAGQAASAVDDVYDGIRGMERTGGDSLVAGGGGEICDLMSRGARKQTIEYARRSSGIKTEWTCQKAIGLLVGRSQRLGGFGKTLKAEVVGVNAEGDRATATIRFGKGPLTTIPMVREDGEWKLGTSPATGGK
ncbi:MAG: hypothetical protein WEB79_04285 [Thermoleophilaceae bacterium]